MQVEVLSLEGPLYQGKATEVGVTTANGQLGILPNHEPMTATLVPCTIQLRLDNRKMREFATLGGLIEIAENQVRILTEPATTQPPATDELLAAAIERAQTLTSSSSDKPSLAHAHGTFKTGHARIDAAGLRRRPRKRRQQ